jgi:broad specificity phosphatase PhoE
VPIVLLIRHAQASFGAPDYDVLSARGHWQVEALARSLAQRGIAPDLVVSGSLRRHRDTARPWALPGGARAIVDERWNEYDDDDVLSHHSSAGARLQRSPSDTAPALSSREFQLLLDDALRRWVQAGPDSGCAGTWPMFLARIESALDDLARELESGQTAMVFSSSGVISAVAASLIGLPDQAFVTLNRVSVNTAITKVVFGRQGRTLVSYNEHCHLDADGGALLTYR